LIRGGGARLALWLLAFLLVAVGVDNADRALAHPDEGRYSEISREMAVGGDWITPRLNGIKYFEKPPLQYWASAAAFAAFGPTEPAARLYVNVCALLTLAVVGFTGRRVGPPGTGLASVLALAASPYFLALGGVVTLDMGLTLWTTAAFCAYVLGRAAPDASASRRRWMLAGWAALALAVLSKGLVGLVLPAGALAMHSLARRDLRALLDIEWVRGPMLFTAIAAPWFVAVSAANPEFARFFFVHEHLQRFLTTGHGRAEPWWYFAPILFAGFLPWMLALPAAAVHAWRVERFGGGPQPLRFAILWAAFMLAFFTLSGSRLPTYLLPAFPPLALVLGRYLVEAPAPRLGAFVAPVALVAIALGAVAWLSPERARDAWTASLYAAASPWMLAAAAVLFATCVAAAVLLRRGRRSLGIVLVALGIVAMVDLLEEAYDRMAPRQSGLALADMLRPHVAPATRLYSVKIYDQTLPFYLQRPFTLVEYTDEFATGLAAEPGRDVPRLEDFPAEWLEPGGAVAIIHPDTYPRLRAQGLPMQVLHEDPRRVLVRKP
jgi:4-amino-4-deoxy-L-arabinose transferase-like glycosyltransferase